MDLALLRDRRLLPDDPQEVPRLGERLTAVDPDVLVWQIPGRHDLQPLLATGGTGRSRPHGEVMAEVPRVREELGYPPLVTPTSQIVGTQAALNVLMGRYKMVPRRRRTTC